MSATQENREHTYDSTTARPVLCYRFRGYEQDGDGGVKSRPEFVSYKFCYMDDLTDEQIGWLKDYNDITLGDFFVGGCGDAGPPSEFLDFLNWSPVWMSKGQRKKVVPPGCVVKMFFRMDLIDS